MTMKSSQMPSREEMLRALMTEDETCDGLFYAGVTTTLIFCRPGCPARKPKPEHVEFYSTAREALFAGFRPCKRCHPMDPRREAPEWVAPLLSRVEAEPGRRLRDQELREAGLEPATVRRHFLKAYGLTFQAYCRARRLASAFGDLRRGRSIDDAVFEHGWESHSGFRDAFVKAVGSAPGGARDGDYIRLAWVETPLGPMAAGATEKGLCLLEFTDRRMMEAQLDTLKRRLRLPMLPGESPILDQTRTELGEYFAGKRRTFGVPLIYPGTDFQVNVWNGLLRIPFGETRSYAQLAAEVGIAGGARAVGHANGLNRIAVLIPCHRVTNANGDLGGYGGGLWRKLRLLETEGALRSTIGD